MKSGKGCILVFFVTVLLILTSPAFAQPGNFSLGILGGKAIPTENEAIDGESDTEFENNAVVGISMMYRFTNNFALELFAEKMDLDLSEDEEESVDIGTLTNIPVMLLLKYQGIPAPGKHLSGHIEAGAGINVSSFDIGGGIEELEDLADIDISIDTDNDLIYEVGAGLDYFLTDHFSINLDGKYFFGKTDATVKVSAIGEDPVEESDDFKISNFQILLGLRFWF